MKRLYKLVAVILSTIILLGALCAFPSAAAEEMTFKPTVKGAYLYGIPAKTTFDELAAVLYKTIIDIKSTTGSAVVSGSNTYIGTGFTVSLNGNSYTAVILGDINSDGVITAMDYQMVKRHYLGTYTIPSDAKLLAAGDDDLDGSIKAYIYLMIKRHVLGNYDMNINYTVPYSDYTDDESGWTTSWV